MTGSIIKIKKGKEEIRVKPKSYSGYMVFWLTKGGREKYEGPFRSLKIAIDYIDEHVNLRNIHYLDIYHIDREWHYSNSRRRRE